MGEITETVCVFNKYGHCKHPKACRYIKHGIPCRFENFCDFDHGDGNTIELEIDNLKDKVKNLENTLKIKEQESTELKKQLKDKEREIQGLRKYLRKKRVSQC